MYHGRGGAVKDHRCCTLRQTRRGGALSLPGFSGVDGCCNRICRGEPACSPVDGSREAACPGGHIGPPLRGEGGVPNQRKIGAKTGPCLRGGTEPAPYRGSGAGRCVRRRGAPGVWLPPAKFRNGIWGVSHRHRPLRPAEGGRGTARRGVVPYGWLRRAAAIALASGAQRSVCGAVARGG